MILQKAQEGFTKQTTRYTDGTTGTTALNILGYAIPDVQGPLISLHPLYNKAFLFHFLCSLPQVHPLPQLC